MSSPILSISLLQYGHGIGVFVIVIYQVFWAMPMHRSDHESCGTIITTIDAKLRSNDPVTDTTG